MPPGTALTHSTGTGLAGLRIFVSYPRGGAAHSWAEQVHADLAARGATVWRDETGIAAGDDSWYARISQGLQLADLVVAVFGSDSPACRWQQREMLQADEWGLPLVAAAVGGARLPLYAKEHQPVPLREGDAAAASLGALAAAVQRRAPAPKPEADTTAGAAIPPEQRRTELAWLNNLLHRRPSRHEAVYEPLAARQLAEANPGLALDVWRRADEPPLPPEALQATAAQWCPEVGNANCDEVTSDKLPGGVYLRRTSAVGLYPLTSAEGVFDLAGNVWEWCLNEPEKPDNIGTAGDASRVLRGGSFGNDTQDLRAAHRLDVPPVVRVNDVGFRVCRVAPIEKPAAGALDAGPLKR